MGLLDWLKPKKQTFGPTPAGVYGEAGGTWAGETTDPVIEPDKFVPGADTYVFDISEWRREEHELWIRVTTHSAEKSAGFGLVIGLSDGTKMGAVELWEHSERRGPYLKERHEWTIPRGHPTNELVLVSHGEQTTPVLRKLEQCLGFEPTSHPALPENTAVTCELIMLRGMIVPEQDRFTARMKVVLPEENGYPYGEFFLNINSVHKQLWVSEKDSDYRIAILSRIAHILEAA